GLVAGDLNGDGRVDLVTTNSTGDSISVLLHDDPAGFLPPVTYPPSNFLPSTRLLVSCVLRDLNGDGALDLVVTDGSSDASRGNILVDVGSGDGGFLPRRSFFAFPSLFGLAIADFDRDGKLDVVVTASPQNKLVLYRVSPLTTSSDCDRNGVPDECQPDCDGD